MANETVFQRYKNNPIITAKAVPSANSIHNSAIVRFGEAYAGVFRVDEDEFALCLHSGIQQRRDQLGH
jgi:beta-1,4-mannooligosaccharide/beta-1,4-mannosyl-N-acetylglucosamine phosphorylase